MLSRVFAGYARIILALSEAEAEQKRTPALHRISEGIAETAKAIEVDEVVNFREYINSLDKIPEL